jgi:hypothetical protein
MSTAAQIKGQSSKAAAPNYPVSAKNTSRQASPQLRPHNFAQGRNKVFQRPTNFRKKYGASPAGGVVHKNYSIPKRNMVFIRHELARVPKYSFSCHFHLSGRTSLLKAGGPSQIPALSVLPATPS